MAIVRRKMDLFAHIGRRNVRDDISKSDARKLGVAITAVDGVWHRLRGKR